MKAHPFFRTTQWALIRHMTPPMIPNQGRGIDTVNFRSVKDSESVDIGRSEAAQLSQGAISDSTLKSHKKDTIDPFEDFNSVTLYHEEEDNG